MEFRLLQTAGLGTEVLNGTVLIHEGVELQGGGGEGGEGEGEGEGSGSGRVQFL